jgi:hypothetical protein
MDSYINKHQEKIDQIRGMIRNTYGGAIQQIKKVVRQRVDQFFDFRYGTLLKELVTHIRSFELSAPSKLDDNQADNFGKALLMVFQEFKDHVDRHLTEVVNPDIMRFVKGLEKEIFNDLQFAGTPFQSMVESAAREYKATMSRLDIGENSFQVPVISNVDWEILKDLNDVNLPPVGELIQYSVKIKTEARFRFTIYKMIQSLKSIFRRSPQMSGLDQHMALKDAVARMKNETQENLRFYFKNYRENLKFQYFFKIADSAAQELQKNILDAYQVHVEDLSQVVALVNEEKIDKEATVNSLQQTMSASQAIDQCIRRTRDQLTTME